MAAARRRLASLFKTCASPFRFLLQQMRHRPLIRLIMVMIPLLIPTYLLLISLLPRPTTPTKTPLLALNFPDPCIIQDNPSGTWYAFATGGWWTSNSTNTTTSSGDTTTTTEPTYKNIQAASAAHPAGPWTYLPSADPLPSPGPWAAGTGTDSQTWAPSILQLNITTTNTTTNATTYILYYAAQLPSSSNTSHLHCIGAATTTHSILGPYTPLPSPLICPLDRGGAIDPSVFRDSAAADNNNNNNNNNNDDGVVAGGRVYLLYKIDGNALGSGGECNNGVAPERSTPIVLQEVDGADGVGLVGEGVEVLDRDGGGGDGPLVEAPDLLWVAGDGGKGRYVLFYSNHCWDGPGYSVHYAVTAEGGNISGPYARADGALIQTGDAFNVTAPGGAASVSGGGWMVFHGDCPEGRCLFGAEMAVTGSTVTVS